MSADPHIPLHLEYLRLSGRSARTIYGRSRTLLRLSAILPVPLVRAERSMLEHWRSRLTCGEEAIKQYVGDVRAFYAWAVDMGYRPDNPAARLPVPRVGRRLPRPISETDLWTALTDPPIALRDRAARVRPMLALAGWAGFRAIEIAFLRRHNVLESASPPALIVAHDATKGRAERIVPMSEFVLEELLRAGLPSAGFVFRRQDGSMAANTPHRVCALCNSYLHDLGITATLHQLRHRFGTMLYRETKDLRLVQELMGHATPRSTAGYTAYDQASGAAAVQALPSPRRLKRVS